MTTTKMTYEAWMRQVDLACERLAGVSIHDLPDVPTRDWFEDGKAPVLAARWAIRNAREGGGE